MTALDRLRLNRADVIRLAAGHGARNVRVFGSVVRGDSTTQSDIDFIVDMDPGRSLLDLVALSDDLEALLGRSVDVLTTRSIHPYVRDRIAKEMQAL